ncbi:unnamed protein product [Phaedon cochleariae]|uniref:F-box domain-containing protein n=1 Tax=Phaedon cochleariae TaxID=80249 RepID=A0A9N9SDQ8_PHACE|nr:unnamed protein product [Phaedon cochleariae]
MECLPNELLIKILGHLDTFDLLQFCGAYEHLDYFLKEKDVIQYLNLSRRFELHDLNITKFISTKMNPSFIKVLNINCLYWIPAQDLKKLLSRLDNLEELHAIDTKLGLYESDMMGYLRLKKLAVSMEGSINYEPYENTKTTIVSKELIALKYLYLKLYLTKSHSRPPSIFMKNFICNLSQLEELWLEECFESVGSPNSINYDYEKFLVQLKDLKKLVIRSNGVLPMHDFTSWGFSKVVECKKYIAASDLIFERSTKKSMSLKRSIFEPKSTALEKAWDVFESRGVLPCGPKEYKLLSMNEDLLNINFEELDFCHTIMWCKSQHTDAALEILRSPNSKGLKKLLFRSCLLQKKKLEPDKEHSRVLFKKPRYGVQSEPAELHPFYKIAENINNLVELEISLCSQCSAIDDIAAYKLIGVFEKLTRLSLQIPLLLDGSFLKEVFTKCKFLESLSLHCTTTNEKFMVNLCQNIRFSTALRDIRLDHKEINIEKLLASLSEINNNKLLRLVLNCDALSYSRSVSHTEPFSDFFEKNRQLILFYLVASKATKKHMFDIQKTIHKFKGVNRGKVFYAKTEETTQIPSAHYDMLFSRNRVAVVNFDEF